VFFTGGDQLAITSQIGDTPVYRHVQDIFMKGGIIGGTSAGAAVMPDTMLVRGSSSESHKVGDYLRMAPGLGLLRDAVVDQHFSQRGRIVRLLAAIAQNPRVLGIGIDEDTAILVRDGAGFDVLGSGAVYVLDAGQVTYSNLTEAPAEEALSVFGVRLHVLSAGDCFDLHERRPMPGRIREPATEEEVGKSAAIDES
jgi:cyanophycinase